MRKDFLTEHEQLNALACLGRWADAIGATTGFGIDLSPASGLLWHHPVPPAFDARLQQLESVFPSMSNEGGCPVSGCTDTIRAEEKVDKEAAMSATHMAREDRIELRATKEEKRLLVAAAAHERLDLTSFIMRNVLPVARKSIDQAERIVLSDRDSTRVLELLENPPKSPPALIAAAQRRIART